MKLNRLLIGTLLASCFSILTAKRPAMYHSPYSYSYEQDTPLMKRIQTGLEIKNLQTKLREDLAKATTAKDREQIQKQLQDLSLEMDKLTVPEEFDQKLGRAIVQGFAGEDAWLYRDIDISNFWDGMWLGLGVASAQAGSKVVKNQVEQTANLLIGGLWESFIIKLIEGTKFLRDGLFHGGHSAFRGAEIVGISKMVNTTFVNLNTMLRDGLKDMLRGQDMTLRLAEDQQETNHRTLGWRMLVGAYVRQIDYIINLIQLRLPYYDKHDQIVFFAEEIVRCLEDVKRILTQAKNVRELDERLDSNKNLINAIKANIANLFERLQELVEPNTQKKNLYASTLPKPGRGAGHDDYYEKDTFPHSMHG